MKLPAVALLLLLAGTGCHRGPELAPVAGTVMYRGQPLANGKIMFVPKKGRSANGRIEQGRIVEVSTFDRSDGALVDNHRVAIFSFIGNPTGMEANIPWAIPRRYGSVETSGLTGKVAASGPNEFQFELQD